MALVSAVTTVMFYAMSDGLESELALFLECARGSDLEPKLYDPQQYLDGFLRDFQRTVEEGVGELRGIREDMPGIASNFYGGFR